MAIQTLVSVETLQQHLDDPDWAIVDCRFSLEDKSRGRRAYLQAHIPGAVYAHLEEDLSGPIDPGRTGRHPLPAPDQLARRFSAWGIGPGVQVIAYDDSGGSIAARLWWCLRWLGHDAVAVLDGGWQAWLAADGTVRSGVEGRTGRRFEPSERPELVVDARELQSHLQDPSWRIVDSRAPERYRGKSEPIDPIAGRIPGAVNVPHHETVSTDQRFRAPDTLKRRFQHVLEDVSPERAVFYCGSGVTAARNLLALAHAGLGEGKLYPGSWSDWITDPDRPIERD